MRTRPGKAVVAVVLVALLMQQFALVQSILMQATGSAVGYLVPICHDNTDEDSAANFITAAALIVDQADAAGTRPHGPPPGAPHTHDAACPFCAAAAHAPIIAHATLLHHAVSFVFVAFHLAANNSPRGPPARQFRARDPPADPLTA